jgi:hypothetical protein
MPVYAKSAYTYPLELAVKLIVMLLVMPLVVLTALLLVMLLVWPLLAAAAPPAVNDGSNASASNAVDDFGAEGVVATLHQTDLAGGTCTQAFSMQHSAPAVLRCRTAGLDHCIITSSNVIAVSAYNYPRTSLQPRAICAYHCWPLASS